MKLSEFKTYSITLPNGTLFSIDHPQVMGIVNVTEDSFYAGSRVVESDEIADRVRLMLSDGVDVIDVGACSTRPDASLTELCDEMIRLRAALPIIRGVIAESTSRILLSVDTFRADVAKMAVEEFGVDIINDISAGRLDARMWPVVRELRVPYVLMHSRGTPDVMRQMTDYTTEGGVMAAVIEDLARNTDCLRQAGVNDVIIDPGFGFAKTVEQNYELLLDLELLHTIEAPILVGLSRKSMIYKQLRLTPDDVLPATIALNTIALEKGAHFLRVHDVEAARQAVAMIENLRSTTSVAQPITTFRNN